MTESGGGDVPGDIENPPVVQPTDAAGANTSNNNNPNHDPYHRNLTHKKWKVVALSFFLVAVVVIAIALGVTLGNKDNGDNATTTSSQNTAIGGVTATDGPLSNGAPNDVTTGSTSDGNTAGDDTEPSNTEGGNEEATDEITDSGTAVESDGPAVVQEEPSTEFLKPNGPLLSKVRMINPSITNGYPTCSVLEEDIRNALKHYANSIISSEMNYDSSWNCGHDPFDPEWGYGYEHLNGTDTPDYEYPGFEYDSEVKVDAAPEAAASFDASGSDGGNLAGARPIEDSYDTNNQVSDADEADIVKSNGKWVFAGYGDVLFAWNATDGTNGISITKMPYNDTSEENCTSPYYGGPFPEPIAVAVEETTAGGNADATDSATSSSSQGNGASGKKNRHGVKRHLNYRGRNNNNRQTMSIMPPCFDCPMPCYKPPKPRILSLLLEGDRLVAIVSEENYQPIPFDGPKSVPPIVSNWQKLVVRVYDISDVPSDGSPLTLLAEKSIKGEFNDARSFDETGILVTTSYLDTWQFATGLYRYNKEYCGLNATEYSKKASELAQNMTDEFATRLFEELELDDDCSNIFQISAMQSGSDEDSTDGNLLSNFVQISRFDMAADYSNQDIPMKRGGAFAPGYIRSIYSSQNSTFTFNSGYSYNPELGQWESSTFILGFDISGDPSPLAIAEIPGEPINQYAADLFDGHLRVATTKWHWWNDVSTTTNRIFVLKVPDETEGSKMNVAGFTKHLGKINESIFAVRYIGDKGYVVTFEQKDPFLVVDLSNYTDPHVVGELEIPGFSSYLHPIEIDGVQLMLGIGQHVNESDPWAGWDGVKISLFDITNSSNPIERTNFIDKNAYSNAQNDFKSFRYLAASQKLILPKSEYNYGAEGNFDGFVVYNITLDSITSSFEIQHASNDEIRFGCWYSAYMPPRSLVFKSKVMTILSHTVKSTDLYDGDEEWKLNLDDALGLNETECQPYFMTGYID